MCQEVKVKVVVKGGSTTGTTVNVIAILVSLTGIAATLWSLAH